MIVVAGDSFGNPQAGDILVGEGLSRARAEPFTIEDLCNLLVGVLLGQAGDPVQHGLGRLTRFPSVKRGRQMQFAGRPTLPSDADEDVVLRSRVTSWIISRSICLRSRGVVFGWFQRAGKSLTNRSRSFLAGGERSKRFFSFHSAKAFSASARVRSLSFHRFSRLSATRRFSGLARKNWRWDDSAS